MNWLRFGHGAGARHRLGALAAAALLLALSILPAAADPVFCMKTDEPAWQYPWNVTQGDLNLDGKLDLVVNHYLISFVGTPHHVYTDSVSVFLGNGDGTFAPRYPVTVGAPYNVAIGDLDQDGLPDLVAGAYPAPYRVCVVRGRGDGTFDPPVGTPIPEYPFYVAVADMNGDGRLDVVVEVCQGPGATAGVLVLLGNGDGTLGPPEKFDTLVGADPNDLAIDDLNRDGTMDIVVTNGGHWTGPDHTTISVLLGNGDGTLQPHQEYVVGHNPCGVALGDVDGDGDLDAAVANTGHYTGPPFTVSVLLGNGDGTFQPKTDYGTGDWPHEAALADVNRDGRLDLLVDNSNYPGAGYSVPGPGSVSLFLGRGDGTFEPREDYATADLPQSMTVGDFDGNGSPDLALPCRFSHCVSVLLNRVSFPGTFGARLDFTTGEAPRGVALGDLDRDGKMDVVVADAGAGAVSVLLGTGTGQLGPKRDFATGLEPTAVAIADLNRDARRDLVVANAGDNTVSVLIGNGFGNFSPAVHSATGLVPRSLAVGDLDRDGRLDVVTGNENGGSVSVFLGDGAGHLAPRMDYGGVLVPTGVALGDLNRDGRLDVAVSSGHPADAVAVFLGNGDGTLRPATYHDTASNPCGVAVADLNRDGRMDLATSNNWSDNVSVLVGNGDGTFQTHAEWTTGGAPTCVAVSDFDLDGRADMAASNSAAQSISVLLGGGGGGGGVYFGRTDYGVGDLPMALTAGDLSGDGWPDVVVTNSASNTVTVLLNGCRCVIPVAVEDFVAVALGRGVELRWRLVVEGDEPLLGVRVQRAPAAEGPYSECTAAPLVPAGDMSFADSEVENGRTYWYRLVLVFADGREEVAGQASVAAGRGQGLATALYTPHEVAGGVSLQYAVAHVETPVRLAVFDVRGGRIWSVLPRLAGPGEYTQVWDARDASGLRVRRGVYFVQLQAGAVTAARKFVLLHR